MSEGLEPETFFKIGAGQQPVDQRRRLGAPAQSPIRRPQLRGAPEVRRPEVSFRQIFYLVAVAVPVVDADHHRVSVQDLRVLHHQGFGGRQRRTRNRRLDLFRLSLTVGICSTQLASSYFRYSWYSQSYQLTRVCQILEVCLIMAPVLWLTCSTKLSCSYLRYFWYSQCYKPRRVYLHLRSLLNNCPGAGVYLFYLTS